MVVCDYCKSSEANCKSIAVDFVETGKAGRGRTMLRVPMHMCEKCITRFMKAFGQFKKFVLQEPENSKFDPKES